MKLDMEYCLQCNSVIVVQEQIQRCHRDICSKIVGVATSAVWGMFERRITEFTVETHQNASKAKVIFE
jgi:hypothetical protein